MRITWRTSAVALLCLVSIAVHRPVLAADSGALADGLEQFNYKRYHAASQCFEQAISLDPLNIKAHYYLGLCFEELKDADSAKQEYETAFRLNPFSEQGHAAREALMQLAGSVEKAKHPTDGAKIFQQAVRQINTQSADNAQRWIDWGNMKHDYRVRLGNIEAGMANGTAQQALQGLRGSPYAREISNQYVLRASYQLTDSQVQANRYWQDAANAARFTRESANSLKQLLSEAPKSNSAAPRLRALGTNLYVRNYGDYDDELPPADPPLELRAQAKSFSDLPSELKAIPIKF
jgi:tetratricopeptide (TPR) repeat protein